MRCIPLRSQSRSSAKGMWKRSGRALTKSALYALLVVALVSASARFVFATEGDDALPETGDNDGELVQADTRAPEIKSVYVTANPLPAGNADETGELFFGADGTAVILEIEDTGCGLVDSEGNVLVALEDPAGAYQEADVTQSDGGFATVTIPLKEGVPFDASVLVTVSDAVGNARTWSLAREGDVVEGGVSKVAENEPLRLPNKEDVVTPAHPSCLILDSIAPELELSGASDGSCFGGAAELGLSIVEESLGRLVELDPERNVLTIFRRGEGNEPDLPVKTYTVSDVATDGTLAFDLSDYGDGCYDIVGSLTDLAGNTGEAGLLGVTVDTAAPVVSVTFDNNHAVGGRYFDAPRTATLLVVDRSFDAEQSVVELNASEWSDPQPSVQGWEQDQLNPELWTTTIPFTSDGTYSLAVAAQDRAGNAAERLVVDEFVIDTTCPQVAIERDGEDFDKVLEAQAVSFEDVLYVNAPQAITIMVTDRNLDMHDATVMIDGDAVEERAWSQQQLSHGETMYACTYTYGETSDASGSKEELSHTPDVRVIDRAGNESVHHARPFVVDLSAPEIMSVTVDARPTSSGVDDASGGDPVQFYNETATMTFAVLDAHRLEKIELCDPSGGFYVGTSHIKRGAYKGSYALELVDGAGQELDTVFDRDIYLLVTDVAGNARMWSMGRDAAITGSGEADSTHVVTINDDGAHPFSLIKDVTAPVVELSGVVAGSYYNAAQTVQALIDELNFSYLQRFDDGRAVLRITKQEGDEGRATSVLEVPASRFEGLGTQWLWQETLTSDGHYVVEASFDDFANNASNVERIGEFTIDMTPPRIELAFDGDDARNGSYYNAARTATITVVEHNFDERLISIQTTGTVGSWTSEGDTHVCTVIFGEGDRHTLTVSGVDRAGNEAEPVTVKPFTIDLTPPSITMGGVAQRLSDAVEDDTSEGILQSGCAYNGVVAPRIVLEDETALEDLGTSFSLTGNKLGDVTDRFGFELLTDSDVEVIQFADIGYGEADGSYDVDADDIYTLSAHARDLAGNEAEESITFSVNRFGSNYLVSVEEGGQQVNLSAEPILNEAPTITVHEINVSGIQPEGDRHVTKEYANVTSEIERDDDGSSEGYRLDALDRGQTDYGWAEYIYTIRSENFGMGSSSDSGDGGQGVYRVNVASDDAASNYNSTASYWASDEERAEAVAKVGTAEFTLDEVPPVIDEVNLPMPVASGGAYHASFHVSDAITKGIRVEVLVDGEPVAVTHEGDRVGTGDYVGEGSFGFTVPARSFAARTVVIRVSDYAWRSDEVRRGGFVVTTCIPEAISALGLVVALVCIGRGGKHA